jgi:hypothetical protein
VLVQPNANRPAQTVSCVHSLFAGCVAVRVQRSGNRLIVSYTDKALPKVDLTETVEAVYQPCDSQSHRG